MKPARMLLIVALVAVPAVAFAQIPVGSRVGTTAVPSGYDDGGRPDPFAVLVRPKVTVSAATADPNRRIDKLGTLSVADVRCTGVMRAAQGGKYASAILEGPNHMSFVVKPQDRLLDGVVKSIDSLGVVLILHTTDVAGAVEGKEVHKLLHPAAEGK